MTVTLSPMPSDIFHASRWTSGNFLFPTVIEVTDKVGHAPQAILVQRG